MGNDPIQFPTAENTNWPEMCRPMPEGEFKEDSQFVASFTCREVSGEFTTSEKCEWVDPFFRGDSDPTIKAKLDGYFATHPDQATRYAKLKGWVTENRIQQGANFFICQPQLDQWVLKKHEFADQIGRYRDTSNNKKRREALDYYGAFRLKSIRATNTILLGAAGYLAAGKKLDTKGAEAAPPPETPKKGGDDLDDLTGGGEATACAQPEPPIWYESQEVLAAEAATLFWAGAAAVVSGFNLAARGLAAIEQRIFPILSSPVQRRLLPASFYGGWLLAAARIPVWGGIIAGSVLLIYGADRLWARSVDKKSDMFAGGFLRHLKPYSYKGVNGGIDLLRKVNGAIFDAGSWVKRQWRKIF